MIMEMDIAVSRAPPLGWIVGGTGSAAQKTLMVVLMVIAITISAIKIAGV